MFVVLLYIVAISSSSIETPGGKLQDTAHLSNKSYSGSRRPNVKVSLPCGATTADRLTVLLSPMKIALMSVRVHFTFRLVSPWLKTITLSTMLLVKPSAITGQETWTVVPEEMFLIDPSTFLMCLLCAAGFFVEQVSPLIDMNSWACSGAAANQKTTTTNFTMIFISTPLCLNYFH